MVGDKFVPLTLQTSVQFRDFGELHFRSFSTNRFSNLATLLSSCVDGFFFANCSLQKVEFPCQVQLCSDPSPESSLSINMQVGRKIPGAKIEIVNSLLVSASANEDSNSFRKALEVAPLKLLKFE